MTLISNSPNISRVVIPPAPVVARVVIPPAPVVARVVIPPAPVVAAVVIPPAPVVAPIPAPVVPTLVMVKIVAKTRLSYKNPMTPTYEHLYLAEDFSVQIPIGSQIVLNPVGQAGAYGPVAPNRPTFVLVDNSYNMNPNWTLQQLVQNAQTYYMTNRMISLPIGAKIMMSNGITVALAAVLDVGLPMNCPILLPANAFRSENHPIQLMNETECVATLV